MRFYGEIQRLDEEQRMVWGYASTEQRATDGKVIRRAAMEGALDDYMQFANIREMHQPSAVGVTREASVDDGGLYVGAHVVDDVAWAKVKAKVYRGFSIGAKITEYDPDDRTVITGMLIREISLVDRPADPGAVFDVWRAADDADLDDEDDDLADLDRRAFTAEQRAKLAETGAAMKDGSFPIENRTDLENAIRAVGRAKDKRAVRRHIMKRARALGAMDLIPEDWNTMSRASTAETDTDTDTVAAPATAPAAPPAVESEAVQRGADTDPGEAEGDEATRAAEGEPGADADAGEGDDAPAAEAEPDPVTRAVETAQTAMAAADQVIATLERGAPETRERPAVLVAGDELRRGLSMVSRLGYLLGELAYIATDSQWEAEIEGDNSKVPGMLRASLLSVGAAYKAMNDEELAELLNGVGVDVALENGIIMLAAGGCDLERAADGGIIPADLDLAALRANPGVLFRRAAPLEGEADELRRQVETLTADRDTLTRSVDDLSEKVSRMADTVTRLMDTAAPAKTGGAAAIVRAVDKGEDTQGHASAPKVELSNEDVQRVLEGMSDQDRAMALTRAALARPVPIIR